MKFERRFSHADGPYADLTFTPRDVRVSDFRTGKVTFEASNVPFPDSWNETAVKVLAKGYIRRAGVPKFTKRFPEPGVPTWLQRSVPDDDKLASLPESERFGMETDSRQVFARLAGCWTYWAWRSKYFTTEEDAVIYHAEMSAMLAKQMGAPNSPQWFNTGLHWAYGITGEAQGHWYVDPYTEEITQAKNAYEHCMPHACFIQSVSDDLVNPGGIMDLVLRESLVFKFGAGSGTNFTRVRGKDEKLSGGGTSSGLLSFLRVGDRAAGATKSGGTTRRAAKMVIVPDDHPELLDFIHWKAREEQKVAMIVAGSVVLRRYLADIMSAAHDEAVPAEARLNPALNQKLREALHAATKAGVPGVSAKQALDYAAQGYRTIDVEAFNTDWDSDGYGTVSGQNSNNSIRVTNKFFKAVDDDANWNLIRRTDGGTSATHRARDIFAQIGDAAWKSADPGLQYDDTINDWNTCSNDGRIEGSNPCSEYVFLNDTACNLASINLGKFYRDESAEFDAEAFRAACRLWAFTLDASVTMAQFPTKIVAERSFDYRTLGLGYANLGSLLMRMGHPYDSVDGYRWCAAITALMTGAATEMSAEMAVELGAFRRYEANAEPMLRVMENHRRAAYAVPDSEYEGLTIKPVTHDPDLLTQGIWRLARSSWDESLRLGRVGGWRNAQATVIAPTGTIALVMQCDTTGIEPNFAVVMWKQLAGGGSLKIVNESIAPALRQLGYSAAQIREIEEYIKGVPTLETVPHVNRTSLRLKGFDDAAIMKVEAALASSMEIESAFGTYILGEDFYENVLKVDKAKSADPRFSLLRDHLGFTAQQVAEASLSACGHQTIEGAPYLREDHLPVFDCATTNGRLGKRFIRPLAHVDMMAAAQPFLSGAISKTINMPGTATIEDILEAYRYAWDRGTKAVAVYRDGSKLAQPLSSSFDFVGFDTQADEDGGKPFSSPADIVRQIVYRYIAKERAMPNRRRGIHQKVTIGGQKLIISTGEYDDGSVGEIYINTHKDGTAMRAMLNNFAIAISTSLQHGVPLEKLVDTFTFTDFMPKGPVVGDDHIKNATSIIDYIFRMLAVTYLNRWDLAHVEPTLPKSVAKDADYASEADGPVLHLSQTEVAMESVLRPASARMTTVTVDSAIQVMAQAAASATQLGNGHAGKNGAATAVAEPALSVIETAKIRASAKDMGYTGDYCNACGACEMKRTGTCTTCMKCGNNDGCA